MVENYDYMSFEDLNIRGLVRDSNLAKLILVVLEFLRL
ncbi:transposase-like fragment [Hydrogenobacter thermophilus TK-6]|uniref:Transposase-like n=1 Tax=Hydrogenobacter thermophilus (strain DSM 6534 / IAM 12695 / TK-6) TaxID=608538 RepID=D3DFU4_HYDTT|nr:transposase-like fragment [Hydrogenobacter thermophilus TK-6]